MSQPTNGGDAHVACVVLTLVEHARTPAASLGSQLCGTGWLAQAQADSSRWVGADRPQGVAVVGADHSEAHWKGQKQLNHPFKPIYTSLDISHKVKTLLLFLVKLDLSSHI